MTRAIVFVKSADIDQHAARCIQYCEEQGYQFEGIVLDDWERVHRLFAEEKVTVAIVATEEQLDPNRRPRIEVVANQCTGDRWEGHTRIIRRSAAE